MIRREPDAERGHGRLRRRWPTLPSARVRGKHRERPPVVERRRPRRVRDVATEGAEPLQMLVEEGVGAGDPRIRLAQLQEALLRDARYVVGIRLHTAGWTVEQGAKFFEEKAFQEPANAYEESRRGAYNPTYLYYTLGKLQVYKLREDYRTLKGAGYTLAEFHDEFLKQGGIPIRIIRRIMLPGDNRPSL